MGIGRTILGRLTRKARVRFMNRAGRWIGRVVDTSADAPSARYAPKRDLYAHMDEQPDGSPDPVKPGRASG